MAGGQCWGLRLATRDPMLLLFVSIEGVALGDMHLGWRSCGGCVEASCHHDTDPKYSWQWILPPSVSTYDPNLYFPKALIEDLLWSLWWVHTRALSRCFVTEKGTAAPTNLQSFLALSESKSCTMRVVRTRH